MKVRAFMLMLLLSLSCSGVWAAEADIQKALPSLSEAEYQELLGGVIVDGSTIGGGSILPYVVPGTEAAKRAAQAQNAEGGFSIAAVSYIPYGPKLKAMDMKTRQLAIFNKIRAISTQEGLTYISWRAGN
ncbi:MAG: hypothetical protein PHO72_12645, partial [Sphaerochaeta sp.]|nr:hypothetical protein [Sphaerochaeta sp.]